MLDHNIFTDKGKGIVEVIGREQTNPPAVRRTVDNERKNKREFLV